VLQFELGHFIQVIKERASGMQEESKDSLNQMSKDEPRSPSAASATEQYETKWQRVFFNQLD